MKKGADAKILPRETVDSCRKAVASKRTQKTPYDLHSHDFFEIEYVYGGSGYQYLNGERHALKPGSLYFLTPLDFHEVYPTPEFFHYNVMFSEEFLTDESSYHMLLSCRGTQVEIPEKEQTAVRSLFENLVCESGHAGDKYSATYMTNLVQCILIALTRADASVADTQEPGVRSMRAALFYLQRHFRDPITLNDISAYVHLTPNYFCSLFRQVVGVRFTDYINDLRARHARRLLENTSSSVTDICYRCGFRSFATFSRVFRKRYGQSPSECRVTAVAENKMTVEGYRE